VNYIDTATDLLIQIPNLPQTSTVGGYSNTVEVIKKHIPRASSIINGKIVRRYDISAWTQTTVPPTLKSICEDIVTYYSLRSLFSGDNSNINEWTEKYYDPAMDELKMIQEGEVDLYNSAGSLIAERSTTGDAKVESNTEDYSPTFGEDKHTSWAVDSDKLDDISDDR